MLDLRYSTILRVAIPLMFASFIQSVVLLTDAAFLSRYSTLAFDANGNAGLLYLTFFSAMFGMSDGSQILIARRIGENKLAEIGGIFQSNIFILTCLALIFFSAIQLLGPLFLPAINNNQELAEAQMSFLHIRSYALLFGIITLSIESYFFAIGKTWIVLIGSGVIAISNVFLDWILIFGTKQIAPMGLEGAALASTTAEAIGMIYFVIAISIHSKKLNYALLGKINIFKNLSNLLKIGSPLFIQAFIALASWTLFFTWIENMGSDELTISQNVRSVYFLAFIPVYGFAYTTKTYISQYIGNKQFDKLKTIQLRIILLSIIFLLLFFHGALLYPESIIRLINPNEVYVKASAEILSIVFASIFLFSIASVFIQTINGSGHTNISFLLELIGCFVYIIYAYLVIKVLHLDIISVWFIEYVYYGIMLLLAVLYIKLFNWKDKKI
jgi:putative MATE family efflux protein